MENKQNEIKDDSEGMSFGCVGCTQKSCSEGCPSKSGDKKDKGGASKSGYYFLIFAICIGAIVAASALSKILF